VFYERIIRQFLFKLYSKDPEIAHEKALALLKFIGEQEWLARFIENFTSVEDPRLEQEVFGLKFKNPVGLAAGFDKNAIAIRGIAALGFGFVEIGTITPIPQEGYPRPRIFYLPQDEALINRMGFPNDGGDTIAKRLKRIKKKVPIPLGINLGKSATTPLEKATEDYISLLKKLYLYGDYFVVNISSPNTPGLTRLQEKEYLDTFLLSLRRGIDELTKKTGQKKPILVKISPDLNKEQIDELLEICLDRRIDGLIAVNTTISREGLSVPTKLKGGLSGRPLWKKAIEIVRYIAEYTRGEIPIIGVGGIFTAEQAYEMLKYANLIQIYTAIVYRGPFVVRTINRGLIRLMEEDGFKNISELRVY
jgi:dihydroorotate dehydrogenase